METAKPSHKEKGPAGQVYYYKIVAKTLGKLLSIYDGKTEYILGKTLYQPVKDSHQGGYYVYATLEEAIFADVPFKKGGLYIAPRTIIKCMCWGEKIEYDNGKIAVSYLCPIQDMGIPRGYLGTKAAMREAHQKYEEEKIKNQKQKKKINWKQYYQTDSVTKGTQIPYTISIKEQEYKQEGQQKPSVLKQPLMFN